MSAIIRVCIVDDHAILREGLKIALRDAADIQFSGEADTAASALALLNITQCDVVLLDVSLPDRSGLDLLRDIREAWPKIATLVLTMHREEEYAVRALKAGAAGFMNKQSAPDSLLAGIRTVASGRKHISPQLAQELARQLSDKPAELPHTCLSEREYQTLTMIASGKAVSEIALDLGLSVKTVSMYRTRLLEKMRMRHNAELTHYAIRNGLVK